jgi:hypothetical protein
MVVQAPSWALLQKMEVLQGKEAVSDEDMRLNMGRKAQSANSG